jgi:cell division protein ZapA
MENRITVTICGEEYTFTAEESPSYMQKVAGMVDEKMSYILNNSHVSRTDAAILAAVNIADEYFKNQGASENIRAQLKGYLDEASKAKAEVSELKREVFRLQQQLGRK